MNIRGIGGDIKIEVLYDSDDKPTFLLGVSNSGYLIMSRSTNRCIESGEGNPYADFEEERKYYGGALCYYIADDDQFLDIGRNSTVSTVPYTKSLIEAVNGTTSVKNAVYLPSASATATITETVIIPYSEIRIRKKAFGYNNDNTCSAVACTLALDYIDCLNNDVVPDNYRLENLNSGKYTTTLDVEENYPKAHAFHRFLVEKCGMGVASHMNGITSAISEYANSSSTIKNTNLKCQWTVNLLGNYAVDQIDAGRPAMLTSYIAGDYSWHTMLIYGYRKYSDGSLEWLVHPGWYTEVSYYTSGQCYHINLVWVSASTATYLYRFQFDDT